MRSTDTSPSVLASNDDLTDSCLEIAVSGNASTLGPSIPPSPENPNILSPDDMLREGNVSSADRWLELLMPIVERYRRSGLRMLFHEDAEFARPEIYEYAIRLPANQVLG